MNKEAVRAVKFALFSISAGLIETASFTLLELATSLSYWACYLPALVLSVLWNFTLNRRFTFQSVANVPMTMLKVAAFYAVFTPLSTVGGHFLSEWCGWNDFAVLALTLAVNFVTEFLYQRFFVFGKSIDTRKK